MQKTLARLQHQIAVLERQAEELRAKEVDETIARIRKAIEFYGLTAQDLGLMASPRRGKRVAGARLPASGTRRASQNGAARPKFRDGQGNTWSGRGRRPGWFKSALSSGMTPEQLAA